MGKSWKRLGMLANAKKKSRTITKMASEISVATRLGGKDPQKNARLRLAIECARRESCPKDTIERAILRGAGELEDEKSLSELFYEGYGLYGVALIIHVQTDNRVRTIAEIRSILKKEGGSLGETGSVQWLFDRCNQVIASLPEEIWNTKSKNWDPEEEAIEVEADGVEPVDLKENKWLFWGDVKNMECLKENLEKKGWVLDSLQLAFRAKEMISFPLEKRQKVVQLIEALQNSTDCYAIYTNCKL